MHKQQLGKTLTPEDQQELITLLATAIARVHLGLSPRDQPATTTSPTCLAFPAKTVLSVHHG